MPTLFRNRPLQEEGQVNIFNAGSYFLAATYTENIAGVKSGTVLHMYDGDTSTLLQFSTVGSGAFVKWAYKRKIRFKNIFIYLSAGGFPAGTHNVKLQGSDNDSDWTDLATQNVANFVGDTFFEFAVTNVYFKYYRVFVTTPEATHWVYIRQAKAIK